jgi:glycosyltransferase involved in cell wall biosynthesis
VDQQTHFPLQHIIADDCSDDGTQDIILNYAKKYPHIISIFQKKRTHGSGNIRALFDMARTDYVALCDGDDYFTDPGKLQIQADFLDASPDCALCFHPVRVMYENNPQKERIFPSPDILPSGVQPFYSLDDLIAENIIQTNSVMYRWRFKDGLPDWFRTDLTPSDWYWHLLHAEQGKIAFIDRIMSVYRRHAAGVFYLSEVDQQTHRFKVGHKELQMYDVINRHFKGKYESVIFKLADDVIFDCVVYAEQTGDDSKLQELNRQFPHFIKHFLVSVKQAGKTQ